LILLAVRVGRVSPASDEVHVFVAGDRIVDPAVRLCGRELLGERYRFGLVVAGAEFAAFAYVRFVDRVQGWSAGSLCRPVSYGSLRTPRGTCV
jgi:hypothetical protein